MESKKVNLSILASSDDQTSSPVTQYLKAQFEKVLPGMTLNIRNVPGQVATQDALKGEFDIYLSGWGADFNDPISFLQIPESGTAYNYGKYRNETYDKLINRAQNRDANNAGQRWMIWFRLPKYLTRIKE